MVRIIQTVAYQRWENGLRDERGRAAIAARISRLAYGLAGDMKSVGGGVSELRIHYGPGYRVYFTRREEEIVLLLCGGDKSSQNRDIERAKNAAAQLIGGAT
jgi:putative addiction module killer protein